MNSRHAFSVAVASVATFVTGCAGISLDRLANEAVQGTVNFGRDFLSGTSEFVGAAVDLVPATFNINAHCPTIPWRHEDEARRQRSYPGTESTINMQRFQPSRSSVCSASNYLQQSLRAYREFDYDKGFKVATDALGVSTTSSEKGQAHILRGACSFLLNDLNTARADFVSAKEEGLSAMDLRIFPADMVEFFNRCR